jgi:hypothetical protein
MDKNFNLIVAQDENGKDIIINIYVDDNKKITGVNFGGIPFPEEELEKFELNTLDDELYNYLVKEGTLNISTQSKYSGKSASDIIAMFKNNFKNS